MRSKILLSLLVLTAACQRMSDVTGPHLTPSNDVAITSSLPSFSAGVGVTAPSPAGLVACYSGEGNGTEPVSGATATVNGAVSFVPGVFGQAFSFDALGGDVTAPANPKLDVAQQSGITISAWFFPKGNAFGGVPGSGPIVEFDNGSQIWVHSQVADPMTSFFTNMSVDGTSTNWHIVSQDGVVTQNAWNHGVATYDKATGAIAIYVNGVLVKTGTTAPGTPVASGANPLHIGSRAPGSFALDRYTFNGLIDEVQIYSRALQPAEVATLVNANGTMCVSPATQFVVTQQPSTTGESGVPLTTQPIVQLRDATGTLVSNGNAAVTATITSGTGTLLGTTTVNAVGGIATFTDLAIAGSGSNTISFSVGALPNTGPGPVASTVAQVARGLALVTSPSTSVSGAPLAPQPSVRVVDAAGLAMPGASNPITVAIGQGTGTLTGTTTVNASNALATFTNLAVNGFGSFTLVFSSAGLASVETAAFSLSAAPVGGVVFTAVPATTESGIAVPTPVVIELRDANGVRIAGATNSVTLTVAGGTATLGGSTSVNAVDGIATFSDLKINGVGPVTLKATVGASTATSGTIAVTQMPRALYFVQQPLTATSGQPMGTWIVEVRDGAGIKMTSANIDIRISLETGNGTLSTNNVVKSVNGTATFNGLVYNGSGSAVFNAWVVETGMYAIAYNLAQPVAVAISPLGIVTQPSGGVSGSPLSTPPTVEIRDANGARINTATNPITVSIASGTGALLGTTTVNAVAGVATFTGLGVTGTGNFTLQFSSPGLTPATSGTFAVTTPTNVQTPTALTITQQPTTGESGGTLGTIVVQLKDNTGALVTAATNPITLTIASGTNGTITGTTTVAAVGGIATFTNVKLGGIGAYTLKASLSQTVTATTTPITLTQQIRHLAVTAQPTTGVSGISLGNWIVEVRDSAGIKIANSTVLIRAAMESGAGVLSGTTQVNAIGGVATFPGLIYTGTGAVVVNFWVIDPTAYAAAYTVSAPVLMQASQTVAGLALTTQPSATANSGAVLAAQPIIEIRDANGVKVVGSTLAVTASIASGTGGTFGGTTTVTAVNGVATFTDLKITGSGAYTIKFTASGATAATSNTITIASLVGAATKLGIVTQPGNAEVGVVFGTQPVIQILDANGNRVTTWSGTVTVANGTTCSGGLSGTLTVPVVNGVATFTNLKINDDGAHTLKFTATGLTSVTSASFNVTNTLRQVYITSQPTTGIANTVLSPLKLELRNGMGSRITSATNAVTATVVSGPGTLSGTTTVNAVGGVATFTTLKVSAAGTYKIKVASGAFADTTGTITINVANVTPKSLAVITQPTNVQSGVVMATAPVVEARDAQGNRATSFNGQVTVRLVGGDDDDDRDCDGEIGGTVTVTAVNGVATFSNLKVTSSGTVQLKFSATGLTSAYSNEFKAKQVATRINITAQDNSATVNTALSPALVVQIQDAAGRRVGDATNSVTVTVLSGPGTLSGTTTRAAVNGAATFSDLKLSAVGSYKLKVTSGTFADTSATITITAAQSFTWGGFYDGVADAPSTNYAKAGQEVEVKFRLTGTSSSRIFASGYPASQAASCTTKQATGALSAISIDDDDDYNRYDGKYKFTWKTSSGWKNSCRILVLKFADGTSSSTFFNFNK